MIGIPKKAIDLTGQKFGKLFVIEMVRRLNNGRNELCCRCKCDCGNEAIINAYSVKKGVTKSCGCLERESRYGRKHGKYRPGDVCAGFTLLKETPEREKNHAIIWECKCNICGNIIKISPSTIIKNNITSCGCDYVHPLLKDLCGMRFGMLTVDSIVPRAKRKDPKYRRVMWNCTCDCGTKTIVAGDMLTSSKTTSCGCRMNKSAMVFLIKNYMTQHNIKFYEEYRFKDCRDIKPLPFDFYLPEYNTIIEYDGQQHYISVNLWGGDEYLAKIKKHDEIKNEYCEKHGISLIRLPYYYTEQQIYEIIDELEPVTSKRPA